MHYLRIGKHIPMELKPMAIRCMTICTVSGASRHVAREAVWHEVHSRLVRSQKTSSQRSKRAKNGIMVLEPPRSPAEPRESRDPVSGPHPDISRRQESGALFSASSVTRDQSGRPTPAATAFQSSDRSGARGGAPNTGNVPVPLSTGIAGGQQRAPRALRAAGATGDGADVGDQTRGPVFAVPPIPGTAEELRSAMARIPQAMEGLQPEAREQLQDALDALPRNAALADQMIALLARVRFDMAQDIERKHSQLHEQMKCLHAVVDKLHDGFTRYTIEAKSKQYGLVSRKRKTTEPPTQMEYLDILLNPEQGAEEHLGFLLLITVTSFAFQEPAFQSWLDAGTVRRMTPYAEIVRGTCGLGIIYFGSVKDFGLRKYQTRVASLWSLVLRFVLAQKVGLTKKWIADEAKNFGRDVAAYIPPWLHAFGNFGETYKLVENIVSVEENTDRAFLSATAGSSASRGSSGSRERARKSKEPIREEKRKKMGLTGTHDPLLELQVYAVLNMRKEFLSKLTTGRNEARKILYKDLFFLVEKIASYGSVAQAAADGYAIEFKADGAPSDQRAAYLSPTSQWKIGLCERFLPSDGDINKGEKSKRNLTKFNKLAEQFPFLCVDLVYKKFAKNPTTGTTDFLEMRTPLSLYKPAVDGLLAVYKKEDLDEIMALSDLALRAIHVHAVGLYALLRKFYNFELSPIEKSCLGHLTWKDLSACLEGMNGGSSSVPLNSPSGVRPSRVFSASDIQECEVTVMYGGGSNLESENEERPSLLVSYRKMMFEMDWDVMMEEKNTRELERQSRATGVASTQSAFRPPGEIAMEEGDDDTFGWVVGAGAE